MSNPTWKDFKDADATAKKTHMVRDQKRADAFFRRVIYDNLRKLRSMDKALREGDNGPK